MVFAEFSFITEWAGEDGFYVREIGYPISDTLSAAKCA
jgi:hypothetical protein